MNRLNSQGNVGLENVMVDFAAPCENNISHGRTAGRLGVGEESQVFVSWGGAVRLSLLAQDFRYQSIRYDYFFLYYYQRCPVPPPLV